MCLKDYYMFMSKSLENGFFYKKLTEEKLVPYEERDIYTYYFKKYINYELRDNPDPESILALYLVIFFILMMISSMIIENYSDTEFVKHLAEIGRFINSYNTFPKDYYHAIVASFFIILHLQFIVFLILCRESLVILYKFINLRHFLEYYYYKIILFALFIFFAIFFDISSISSTRSPHFDLCKNYFKIMHFYMVLSVPYFIILAFLFHFNPRLIEKTRMEKIDNYFLNLFYDNKV